MNADDIIKRVNKLHAERNNYATFWQDVAKYVIPRKAYITRVKTKGSKYDYDIYDSTAMQSNLVLGAGLHSYLTNPNSRWFSLMTEDEELNNESEVKDWLSDTEERIYNTLNTSNFNQQIHELYLDLGCFGVGCMYEEEDEITDVRFYSRDIGEIYIVENEKEVIDTLFRKFKLSARQAFEKWGDEAGDIVKAFIDKKDYEKEVTFIHAVYPRHERDVGKKDSINMPFASVYLEESKKHIITESGYEEFPYFVPRFNKNSGEVWGSSPGMVSYSDIKMVNTMCKTMIRAAQVAVDPPLVLPHDGFLLPIKYGPRALNFRTKGTYQDRIEPLITNLNLPIGLEMVNEYRNTIRKNYFVDLFLLLADPARKDMTATEVMQRVEEKMLILAPVLGRLMNEFLEPLISRTFNILLRKGKLLPPPDAIMQNPKYVVKYISPLARAQKLDQMKSINNFLMQIAQIAQVQPEIIDKVNADNVVDEIQDLYGVKPEFVRDEEEVGAIREQRAQAQAQAQEMALLQQGAQAGKDVAQIDKTMKEEAK